MRALALYTLMYAFGCSFYNCFLLLMLQVNVDAPTSFAASVDKTEASTVYGLCIVMACVKMLFHAPEEQICTSGCICVHYTLMFVSACS